MKIENYILNIGAQYEKKELRWVVPHEFPMWLELRKEYKIKDDSIRRKSTMDSMCSMIVNGNEISLDIKSDKNSGKVGLLNINKNYDPPRY